MAKSINVPVTASTAPFRKSLQNAQKDLTRFGNQAGATMKKTAAAMAATGAAATFVGMKWYKMAEQAYIADRRIERIAISMGLFGVQTSKTTTRLQNYADALERETGIMAETIKLSQAKLLTFRQLAQTADVVGGAFDRATQATIDMAAAGFGSAEQNAVQLGKALEDPIKGVNSLRRSGITFTESEKQKLKVLVETGKVLEAQNVILTAVETQVKGTAKATRSSTERMKLAFGEVTDRLMSDLIPVMEKVADAMVRIGEKATTEGLGSAVEQVGAEVAKLGYNADGTVSAFGRVINASRRLTNPIVEVKNGFYGMLAAMTGAEYQADKTVATMSDLTGETKRLYLASKGYVEQLSGIIVYGGKVVETQEQLNRVMGPVASRNIIDFMAHLEKYRKELARQEEEQAKRRAAAEEASRKAAEAAKKRTDAVKESLKSSKAAIRDYVASIRDRINAEVSLSSAVSDATSAEETRQSNLTAALENRREAYAALHQARATGDTKAYGAALEDVAAAEKGVTDAQAVKPKNYTAIFADQIAAAKAFGGYVKQLVAAGLGKAGLAQILDLGPVAGAQVAKDLLAGTGGMTIASLTQDLADIAASGTAAGMAIPGYAATLGATVGGPVGAPTIIIEAGVGDPVAIGKQVAQVLEQYGTKTGGVPITTKKPKAPAKKKTPKRSGS